MSRQYHIPIVPALIRLGNSTVSGAAIRADVSPADCAHCAEKAIFAQHTIGISSGNCRIRLHRADIRRRVGLLRQVSMVGLAIAHAVGRGAVVYRAMGDACRDARILQDSIPQQILYGPLPADVHISRGRAVGDMRIYI